MAIDTREQSERMILVVRYATPLAVTLVCLGIFFSNPVPWMRNLCLGILSASVAYNVFVARLLRKETAPAVLLESRLAVNLGANALLIYLLGVHFKPMWLLLALTPLSISLYGSRAATSRASIGIAILLLAIQALRVDQAPLIWAEQLAYGLFVGIFSLLIHELRHPRFSA